MDEPKEYAALRHDETEKTYLIVKMSDGTWRVETEIGQNGRGDMSAAVRIATAMNRQQHT